MVSISNSQQRTDNNNNTTTMMHAYLPSQHRENSIEDSMDSIPTNVKLHNLRRILSTNNNTHDQKQQRHPNNSSTVASSSSSSSFTSHVSLTRRKSSRLDISSLLCESPESFPICEEDSSSNSSMGDTASQLGDNESFHKTPATTPPLSPNGIGDNHHQVVLPPIKSLDMRSEMYDHHHENSDSRKPLEQFATISEAYRTNNSSSYSLPHPTLMDSSTRLLNNSSVNSVHHHHLQDPLLRRSSYDVRNSDLLGFNTPPKRKRANANQLKVLNEVFHQTFFPSTELRIQLGKQLGMSPRTVQIWFQNKRQSWRSKSQDEKADNEIINNSRRSSNSSLHASDEEEDIDQRTIPDSPLETPLPPPILSHHRNNNNTQPSTPFRYQPTVSESQIVNDM
ncbi:2287_t:CDS:2 [Diversispora eburnea]|uniref:2287_t:CDS:1 n=1 Tax=Diversispora eburnea TaxID=1213867 RepID=A0A9N8Z5Y6_9GLOM|nr:2287_t:CDS:2 [Diversispora eburnea]